MQSISILNPATTAVAVVPGTLNPPHSVVFCEREQRKVDRIIVIAEIEHAGEAGSRVFQLVPAAVGPLRVEQVINAPLHRAVIVESSREEAQHGPGGLRSSDRAAAAKFRLLI